MTRMEEERKRRNKRQEEKDRKRKRMEGRKDSAADLISKGTKITRGVSQSNSFRILRGVIRLFM